MKRFENAEVGDRVWSKYFKKSGIVESTLSGIRQVVVNFGDFERNFTLGGYEDIHHDEPSLFYLDANGNKCTERPEQPIDWESVEPGTVFEVRSNIGSDWLNREFIFYAKGKPWFLYEHHDFRARPWNYIRRIK